MLNKREAKVYFKWLQSRGTFVRQCPTLNYQENRLCAMEMYWSQSLHKEKLEQ